MEIVNCCPHALHYHHEDGTIEDFEPCGIVIRAIEVKTPTKALPEHETYTIKYLIDETCLPKPSETPQAWVVSNIAAAVLYGKVPENVTLLYPGDLVRNDKGMIIGCKGFVEYRGTEIGGVTSI